MARRFSETSMTRYALALALFLVPAGAALAQTRAGLPNEPHATAALVEARVADRVRRECSSIDGRMLRAISEARQLKAWANGQGYSDDEIRSFLESREQKNRIYALADARLQRNGAVPGKPETYCAAGRAEIEAGTLAGSLLR